LFTEVFKIDIEKMTQHHPPWRPDLISIISETAMDSFVIIENNTNNNTNGTNTDLVPEWFGWIGVAVW